MSTTPAERLVGLPTNTADRFPLGFSVDVGVRGFPMGGTHLATTRFSVAVDKLLLDVRHATGPVLGPALPVGPGGQPYDRAGFHVATIAVGFRHRLSFGDHHAFLDTVGYVGGLWTPPDDGYPDSYGGRARYGVGGLEARVGLDLAVGPLRGLVTLECGYAQSRRARREDPTAPPPVRPVSGMFLGASVGLGWSRPVR